jgi:hypothetical protein
MENLLTRIGRLAFLIVLGACLITYAGIGILYLQQGPKQKDLQEQINKTLVIVQKPLPDMEKLQAKLDEVNRSLAPMSIPEALEVVVSIAEKSGIDVDPASGKFNIPPPAPPRETKIGESTYRVLSLSGIRAQGDYESVMAFISDLDSGKTLETMVLKRVDLSQVEIRFGEEETARRAEFRMVMAAVKDMMAANGITEIPNPIDYEGGVAVNDMAAFPDIITTAAEKGYTGNGTPKDGYLLYEHDRILTDNTTDFETVSYISEPTTRYYYTCEADGTVRQFDGPDLATATEYFGSEQFGVETVAIVSVELYSKPVRG